MTDTMPTEPTGAEHSRYLYDLSEGDASMRTLLGGKGANIAEMMRLGVPVPDGFTVTTSACVDAMNAGGQWPDSLWEETLAALTRLEERTGRTLGGTERPLLVSVRSGAVHSMPGMMDTILNLGISDTSVAALGAEADNPRFAWDSYRRFIQMYGEVVEGVPAHTYEDALTAMKRVKGVEQDTDLSIEDLQELVEQFKEVSREHLGTEFPTDPREQLKHSIDAVFASWQNPRAGIYRRANHIPDDLGTAVNIMQMVFGNRGDTSATGVCFTRNPSTGAKELYGEFLVNAQGEDVVAGIRTPRPLAEMEQILPEAFGELTATMDRLEAHYGDMQDIEFTVEEGTLFLLQTRNGKRTAPAAFKVVRDLVDEGVLTREQALRRIEPGQLDQLLHPAIDPGHGQTPVTKGLNASPGAAVGEIVFDSDTAATRGKAGDQVILVRWETTPDDIAGTIAAQGVLTAHGGMTSHAAVVARGMGKPCVAGASAVKIDTAGRKMTIGDTVLREGETITLDGSTGEVYLGALDLVPPQVNEDFSAVVGWADEIRRLGVRANADTGQDAAKAREFGAEGIGLCRTEHMFMAEDRLPAVRRMILAQDEDERAAALEDILPMQQQDFEAIFEAMSGLPVTIRLLDPPLHEFLPDLVEQALTVQRLELTNGSADRAARGPHHAVAGQAADGDEPDAGHPWGPPGPALPGDPGDAGARHRPGRVRGHRARRHADRGDHGAAGRLRRGAQADARADRRDPDRGVRGRRPPVRLHDRHDDRAPARGGRRRPDRGPRRLLLLRHQRPDPDRYRHLPGRCRGLVPGALRRLRHRAVQPVRLDRRGRCRRAGPARGRGWPAGQATPEGRCLRRARRRPSLDHLLPRPGDRLRLLLALPRADRPVRGGQGGPRRAAAVSPEGPEGTRDHLPPSGGLPLTDLDRLGGFFGLSATTDGLVPLSEALLPDPLQGRFGQLREALAASGRVPVHEVDARMAVSAVQVGLVSRLWSVALASTLLAGWVPDLSLPRLWVSPDPRGPVPMAIGDARAGREVDPEQAAGALVDLVLLPGVQAISRRCAEVGHTSSQVLDSNSASALVSAARQLVRREPRLSAGADDLLRRLWEHPLLAAGGGWVDGEFTRHGCCLYYRLPGHGLCPDCVLVRPATTH